MPSVTELFAQLNTALAAGGPESPEVAKLVAAISQGGSAELSHAAAGAVNAARISRGLTPGPTPAAGTSWYLKYLPWLLAALGLGGTAAGVGGIDLSKINVNDLPSLPPVTNRWTLLGILAAVGAVVGTVHSIYRNGGLVFPAVAKDNAANMLVVRNYGFVGDLFWGAVSAAAASWTAHPATTGQDGGGNLLQWNLICSAIAAAFAGAKAWSGWRGNQIGKEALTQFLPPGSPEPATIADAAVMATGMKIPGHEPPPGTQVTAAQIEQDLFARLLDARQVAAVLPQLAKPPGPEGDGLTAEVLRSFQVLAPELQIPALRKLSLADIARMSKDDFLRALGGIDVSRFGPALEAVHAQAIEAMNTLHTLPANWTLAAVQPPK
jgi:hypothetical protein